MSSNSSWGDFMARAILLRLGEIECDAGNLVAAARLLRICVYLEDREAYVADPPPDGDWFPLTFRRELTTCTQ